MRRPRFAVRDGYRRLVRPWGWFTTAKGSGPRHSASSGPREGFQAPHDSCLTWSTPNGVLADLREPLIWQRLRRQQTWVRTSGSSSPSWCRVFVVTLVSMRLPPWGFRLSLIHISEPTRLG